MAPNLHAKSQKISKHFQRKCLDKWKNSQTEGPYFRAPHFMGPITKTKEIKEQFIRNWSINLVSFYIILNIHEQYKLLEETLGMGNYY